MKATGSKASQRGIAKVLNPRPHYVAAARGARSNEGIAEGEKIPSAELVGPSYHP